MLIVWLVSSMQVVLRATEAMTLVHIQNTSSARHTGNGSRKRFRLILGTSNGSCCARAGVSFLIYVKRSEFANRTMISVVDVTWHQQEIRILVPCVSNAAKKTIEHYTKSSVEALFSCHSV